MRHWIIAAAALVAPALAQPVPAPADNGGDGPVLETFAFSITAQ